MNYRLSSFLDLSRWVSAFLVVLGHVAHILIVDKSHLNYSGGMTAFFYFMTSLGHEAVVVFFVISGYLVGGISLDKWMRRGVNITDYAINRFARIYTVLIPALTIGYLLDSLGARWFDVAGLYSSPAQYNIGSLGDVVSIRLNFLTYVGNVLMLENIAVPSLGSNGPLWSLAFEWWYYCLFGLFCLCCFHKGWRRLASLLSFLILLVLLPKKLMAWMIIWLLGVAVFFVTKTKINKPEPWLGVAVLIFAVVISWATHNPDNIANPESIWILFSRDAFLAIAYCFVLVCFSQGDRHLPLAGLHKWAAGFSYSMYLFHFPVMLFCVAVANDVFGWQFLSQPTRLSMAYLVGLVALLYLLGYAFSLCTERYTNSIRNFLRNLLDRYQQPRSTVISGTRGQNK